MSTTIVALYDTTQAAQSAASALEQAGYSRSDIRVEPYQDGAQGTSTVETTAAPKNAWQTLLEDLHLSAPKDHVDYYSQGLTTGQTMVTVETTDEAEDRAVEILNANGALDLDERSATYYAGQGFSAPAGTVAAAPVASAGYVADTTGLAGTGQEVIPVIEEELTVGKRQVQGGGVRVYKRVTERPVDASVTLREEHITMDRHAVDRPVTDADTAFTERTYELTETNEVPVVAKEARVVEEVLVGKTATDRTETISDTVRRTDVEVEEIATPATSRL